MKQLALVGNPNSGKTTLFNALTGSRARVGNWPGVTVEKRVGVCRQGDNTAEIVDLPGIYSLNPYTPEEKIARDFLVAEKVAGIINVVDATNLERNLYLTTQLLELNVPVVVALNLTDVLEKRGDQLDVALLASRLGVPVVAVSALRGVGLETLMASAIQAKPRSGRSVVTGGTTEQVIEQRYDFITTQLSPALHRAPKTKPTATERADRILTHRIWGLPIFLLILFGVFHLTFAEDLFYLGLIPSPGVLLANLWNQLVIENILGWAQRLVGATGWPGWLIGLLNNGILDGIASVLSFLPWILVLYWLFALLEDSGYLARVAFLLDQLLRRFGLSGRAFLPLMMGFGCSVPAMLNTRTLADETERVATIRIIPFFTCGAKATLVTALAGGLVTATGVGNADLITYGMYLLGVMVAFVSVLILRRTTLRGETPPLILELPPYRFPAVKNWHGQLVEKARHFLNKAFTIILTSTVVIWGLAHFSWRCEFLPDTAMDRSLLGWLGRMLQPVFTPLGFGAQLGANGWVFAVAVICGLVAKENVVATLATLAVCVLPNLSPGANGVTAVATLIRVTGISPAGVLGLIAFNLTTMPCFASLATARAELGNKKLFWGTIGFWLLTSFLTGTIVYWVSCWAWGLLCV